MNKKILAGFIIAATSFSAAAYAGNLYLGPSLFVQDNTVPSSNFRGIHPRLSLGYNDMLEDMYIAGEIFAVPFTATIQDNYNGPSNNSVKTTTNYGATIIPGAYITDCVLGYVRLGAVYSKFTGPGSWRTGAQFGLGLQVELSRYWDMRAEYIYTAYRSINRIGTPRADEAGLGLVYKVLS